MTRILLTGAAGFIGSHLAEKLLARGDVVAGIDNFDPFYARPIKERNLAGPCSQAGFSFSETDILDTESVIRLLTPETVIVHLAAKAGCAPRCRTRRGTFARTSPAPSRSSMRRAGRG